MTYKGYSAKINYSKKDNVFFGQICNVNDVITFEGKNINELHQSFINAVDDYLDFCKRYKINS